MRLYAFWIALLAGIAGLFVIAPLPAKPYIAAAFPLAVAGMTWMQFFSLPERRQQGGTQLVDGGPIDWGPVLRLAGPTLLFELAHLLLVGSSITGAADALLVVLLFVALLAVSGRSVMPWEIREAGLLNPFTFVPWSAVRSYGWTGDVQQRLTFINDPPHSGVMRQRAITIKVAADRRPAVEATLLQVAPDKADQASTERALAHGPLARERRARHGFSTLSLLVLGALLLLGILLSHAGLVTTQPPPPAPGGRVIHRVEPGARLAADVSAPRWPAV